MPRTALKFTSSREMKFRSTWKGSKRPFQTELHTSSCAPCPGYSRYVHEFTLIVDLLPRYRSQPPNPFQHFIEHSPRHHHLGKLEHKPSGMAHQSPTRLDESRLNTCQEPVLYRFWQSQSSEEVTQIISKDEQRESHLIRPRNCDTTVSSSSARICLLLSTVPPWRGHYRS